MPGETPKTPATRRTRHRFVTEPGENRLAAGWLLFFLPSQSGAWLLLKPDKPTTDFARLQNLQFQNLSFCADLCPSLTHHGIVKSHIF